MSKTRSLRITAALPRSATPGQHRLPRGPRSATTPPVGNRPVLLCQLAKPGVSLAADGPINPLSRLVIHFASAKPSGNFLVTRGATYVAASRLLCAGRLVDALKRIERATAASRRASLRGMKCLDWAKRRIGERRRARRGDKCHEVAKQNSPGLQPKGAKIRQKRDSRERTQGSQKVGIAAKRHKKAQKVSERFRQSNPMYRNYWLKTAFKFSRALAHFTSPFFAIFVLFCGYSRLILAPLGFNPRNVSKP